MNFKLIEKYLVGNTTCEERCQVLQWIEQSELHRTEFMALRRIYDATLLMDKPQAKPHRSFSIRRTWRWFTAAAVILVAVGITYFHTSFMQEAGTSQPLMFASLSAPIGQQTKSILSDGTVVWLNSGSTLELCSSDNSQRHVRLQGEAYLEVAHDTERPFIVETSQMKIRVLGTQFNVNTYTEKQSVVLVSGSVEVSNDKLGYKCRIKPNEMFSCSTSGEHWIETVNTESFTSWINGFLQFQDQTIDKIFTRLGHFYGVIIHFDAEHAARITVSGKLELRNGLEYALQHLGLITPIQYVRLNDDEINITLK